MTNNQEDVFRFHIRIPRKKCSQEVIEFIKNQSSMTHTVFCLIQDAVSRFGIQDISQVSTLQLCKDHKTQETVQNATLQVLSRIADALECQSANNASAVLLSKETSPKERITTIASVKKKTLNDAKPEHISTSAIEKNVANNENENISDTESTFDDMSSNGQIISNKEDFTSSEFWLDD